MSNLQENWANIPDLPYHQQMVRSGMEVYNNVLILPEDGRFDIGYAMMVKGGQKNSVMALGDPGSGKTTFGDLVLGGRNRTEITQDDVPDTLFGYTNPINSNDVIEGKLKALRNEDPIAYLNEISQLGNTGPLHPLWDRNVIEVHKREVGLKNVIIYMTTNFPDGTPRVHLLDEALLSRLGMVLLTGDYDKKTATDIQGRDLGSAGRSDSAYDSLLVPKPAVRELIRSELQQKFQVGADFGRFVIELVNKLNETEMLGLINAGDARIGESLQEVVRAHWLIDPPANRTEIKPFDVAQVAALVFPKLVGLNHVARAQLNAMACRRTKPIEQAILTNRIVARVAFDATTPGRFFASQSERETAQTEFMKKHAYANARLANFDINVDEFLANNPHYNAKAAEDEQKKHRFFGRKANRG